MQSLPNRAKIAYLLRNVNTASQHLVIQAKEILATSRRTARLARNRISGSRKRLSQSGDTVVATASRISAARSTLQRRQRP